MLPIWNGFCNTVPTPNIQRTNVLYFDKSALQYRPISVPKSQSEDYFWVQNVLSFQLRDSRFPVCGLAASEMSQFSTKRTFSWQMTYMSQLPLFTKIFHDTYKPWT